eukprot:TRINITY_DN8617_c0_g1_i2.p1 TRINITY_DN8617_c0_g1~~TRINITY_DN8617_c0_g1_i2.p1  ORF type:complete len:734 (-),score=154.09 TRINITY_DN8617_c0_g1_i2:42-2105(-)
MMRAQVDSDKALAETIAANLEQSRVLTEHMVKILDSFEGRLEKLEFTVRPIHDLTNQLQRVHSSVDGTVNAVQKILDVFGTASKLEPMIRAGVPDEDILPHPKSTTLTFYLASVKELSDAIIYLEANPNMLSAQSALVRLRSLKRVAVDETTRVFGLILDAVSKPVKIDPVLSLDNLALYEDNKPLELIPPDMMDVMKQLATLLARMDAYSYLQILKEKRAEYLSNVCRQLCPPTTDSSDSEVKPTLETRDYKKGTHVYIRLMRTLLLLLKKEREFLMSVTVQPGGSNMFNEVFPHVMTAPMTLFIQQGEDLLKQLLATESIFSILPLLDIWENLNSKLESIQKVIKCNKDKVSDKLFDFAQRLSTQLRRNLGDMEDNIDIKESASEKAHAIPVDGTVHEITANTLGFLKRVFDYKIVSESMLPPPQASLAKVTAFADFVYRMMKSLLTCLSAKAEKARSKNNSAKKALANIFMLNNLQYILNVLNKDYTTSAGSNDRSNTSGDQRGSRGNKSSSRSSGGSDTVRAMLDKANPKFVAGVKDQMDIERANYRASWNKALEFLVETEEDDKKKHKKKVDTTKLTKKKKKKIKARFSGFNAELEELFNTQKRFSIPDPNLCAQLRADIKQIIYQPYAAFLEQYQGVPFTRSPQKYIRYSLETLDEMIRNFFEGTGAPATKRHRVGLLGKK